MFVFFFFKFFYFAVYSFLFCLHQNEKHLKDLIQKALVSLSQKPLVCRNVLIILMYGNVYHAYHMGMVRFCLSFGMTDNSQYMFLR